MEFNIFISYATADRDLVSPIVERFRSDDFSVWIDSERMAGGRSTLDQLADGIAGSAHTVAFLTDTYLQREHTMFELTSSMNRDPASRKSRTILVTLRPLTVELPNLIEHLFRVDLTDPAGLDREYPRIIENIRRDAPRPRPGLDPQATVAACAAPFEHLTEPDLALFLIRQATGALANFLYRREIGEPEHGLTGEALHQRLIVAGKIPTEVAQSLSYIRAFGNFVVQDKADRDTVTRESIEPALAALRELARWVFPDRSWDGTLPRILDGLPRIVPSGEVQLPGTSLRLHLPSTGRVGLGPLFAGRDTAGDEVAVCLTDAPAAVLDQIGRYPSATGSHLVPPAGGGTVDVDGVHCHYAVFPAAHGITAGELADRHDRRLPPTAAYEIGAGVARALAELHTAPQPLAHGSVIPEDILLSRFGSVRLRTPARDCASPEADLRAFPALLRTLLTGSPDGDDLNRFAGCGSATQLRRALEEELGRLPGEPSLRSLLRELVPAAGPAAHAELIESYPVRGLRAWPLGDGRTLVWEAGTEKLLVLDGPRIHWQDDTAVPVRLAATGAGGQVAVGGWDGAVRYFAGGDLVTATRLDGTVGDLTFAADGVVAGSWRHTLSHLTRDGRQHALLESTGGVHRIAMAESGDRFAVADLSGRLAVYGDGIRVRDWQRLPGIADLAYAGPRLALLTTGGLASMGVDDRVGAAERKPGALRLLAGATPGTCLLLVAADPDRPATAPLEVWSIDQDDRHILRTTLPAGYRIIATCGVPDRFTVALPDGGCAYWRAGTEVRAWPDAVGAELSADGRQLAVCLPGQVELYADHE